MKLAIAMLILAVLTWIAGIYWMNQELNEAAEAQKVQKACETDAFNYLGEKPEWCKETR